VYSRKTAAVGAAIIVLAISVAVIVSSSDKKISNMNIDELTEAQQKVVSNPEGGYPELNYSYNAEREWLVLTAERPMVSFTGGLLIGNSSYSPDFLLNTSDSEKKTNIWTSASILESLRFSEVPLEIGLRNLGNSGVADFPVRTGEKLTIKKDFTDKDGDGTQGIENGETIRLFTEQMDGSIEKFAHVSISNNTVRVYRLDPYSDNEWKPCEKERKELCETLQAYNFR
jgi:hypothetical protein